MKYKSGKSDSPSWCKIQSVSKKVIEEHNCNFYISTSTSLYQLEEQTSVE